MHARVIGMGIALFASTVCTGSTAAAEVAPPVGAFVDVSLGRASFTGVLADYDSGAQRSVLGVGLVHGRWGLEVLHVSFVSDWAGRCEDCGRVYPRASFEPDYYGLDVRRAIHLRPTPSGAVDLVIHAGPRLALPYSIDTVSDDRTRAGQGIGFGAGAALEVNGRFLSIYLDASSDWFGFDRSGDHDGLGSLASLSLGLRVGWM